MVWTGASGTWAKALVSVWIAIAAFSLWLRSGFPVHAIGDAAADDALFVRLAQSIQAGDWLGPYDHLTLVKGMFLPLFIAATSFLAIPLRLAEHAAYLGACGLAASLVGRRAGQPWLGVALFGILALNPSLWSYLLARVVRENIYIALSLLLVTLTVMAVFPSGYRPLRRAIGLGVALGLIAAAYWLTREEGLWLLPSLALVVIMGLMDLSGRPALPSARAWHAPAASLLVGGLVGAAGVGTVSILNLTHYGVPYGTEMKSGAYEHAYGALSRIQHDHWRRLVVFPRDAQEKAYAASPAARELAPFLEGAGGEGWRRVGCEQSWRFSAEECPEILGGWFMWALREAATAAGHHDSATDARDYYLRLAREIDGACDDGRLPCLPPRATLAPPFRQDYLAAALPAAGTLLARGRPPPPGAGGGAPRRGPPPGRRAAACRAGWGPRPARRRWPCAGRRAGPSRRPSSACRGSTSAAPSRISTASALSSRAPARPACARCSSSWGTARPSRSPGTACARGWSWTRRH